MALKRSPYELAASRATGALWVLLGNTLWSFFVMAHPAFDAPGPIQTIAILSTAAGFLLFIILQLRAWMVSCPKCNASITGAGTFTEPAPLLLMFDAHRTCPGCGNDNTAT